MKQLVLPAGSRNGDRVVLKGQEHHYLTRVRRVVVGDRLVGLDEGHRLDLQVERIDAQSLSLSIQSDLGQPESSPTELVLFPFLLKGGKLDDVIRQACEAGVSTVIPVEGDHCVSKIEASSDGQRKAQRWSTIAKEAAQQSGNLRVCQVQAPISSKDIVLQWRAGDPLLFFHQTPLDKASLHRYLFPRPQRIGLIVGPEGGLSTSEVARFLAQGAKPVWLGSFVLRAETASLYAVAAVNTILQEASEWTIPS